MLHCSPRTSIDYWSLRQLVHRLHAPSGSAPLVRENQQWRLAAAPDRRHLSQHQRRRRTGRPHRQWPARPDRRHQRWAAGVVRLESGRQDAVLGPVAADFDGDGRPEIALCEVALDIGRTYGRLAAQTGGAGREPVASGSVTRPAARRALAAGGRFRW